jgi:hypothetical protein
VKGAFDTSVLVAGLHRAHPHRGRAVLWIDAVAMPCTSWLPSMPVRMRS